MKGITCCCSDLKYYELHNYISEPCHAVLTILSRGHAGVFLPSDSGFSVEPVCAYDLQTDSDCLMGCYVAEVCLDVHCQHGARCRAGVCVCPLTCPEGPAEPVCASDQQTYKSECHMLLQACATDPLNQLTVLFFGACSVKFKTSPISKLLNHMECSRSKSITEVYRFFTTSKKSLLPVINLKFKQLKLF